MANYRIPAVADILVINPTIEIDPVVKEVNPIAMTIAVDVTLISADGTRVGLRLNDVAVVDLNYSSESLRTRVLIKLSELEE